MYHIFFIHSFANGHLGCFHVFATVNRPAVNNRVHISFLSMFFSEYMPRSGTAESSASSDKSLSCVRLFKTPWTTAHQASLSITIYQSLLKLMSMESVMPSNHLILCHPFLRLPSIFPSTRVFSSESVLRIRWPKYWSFSFSNSPSNEYSRLISFRIDWFDLLAGS